jgi:hypothetical protein
MLTLSNVHCTYGKMAAPMNVVVLNNNGTGTADTVALWPSY